MSVKKHNCESFKFKKISTHREKEAPLLKIIRPDKDILSVKEIVVQEDSSDSGIIKGKIYGLLFIFRRHYFIGDKIKMNQIKI